MLNIKKNLNAIVRKIESQKPIILCITNIASINDVINVCSYINAIPVISTELNDAKSILINANALLINIGTINHEQLSLIKKIYAYAKKLNKIVVVDPVGYGISKIRTKIIDNILNDNYTNVIIKGNQTEITKILDKNLQVNSVNNSLTVNLMQSKKIVKEISQKYNKPIIMSGKNDIFCYKNDLYIINNGNDKMNLISGTGCMLGALITCFVSVTKNVTIGCVLALLIFAIVGEMAFENFKENIHGAKNEILSQLPLILNNDKIVLKYAKLIHENQ